MTDDDKALCEALLTEEAYRRESEVAPEWQAAERIRTLSAELDTVRKLARWNTNMEEALKDGTPLLLWWSGKKPKAAVGVWDKDWIAWLTQPSRFTWHPTAWMPIPAPPEQQP